jgi:hypothetical protein
VQREGSLLGVRIQTCTLLGDDSAGVVLEVEQVPHVLGQVRALEAELQAGDVTHVLLALLPNGVLLITNQEECKRCVGGDSEAVLTPCSESHMHHLLDRVINIIVEDGTPKQCCGVEWYLHPDLTRTQAVCLNWMAAVSGNRPIVEELDESAQERSWEPRAVLACGPEEAILAECTVGVVIEAHMKNRHENITNPRVINSEK